MGTEALAWARAWEALAWVFLKPVLVPPGSEPERAKLLRGESAG